MTFYIGFMEQFYSGGISGLNLWVLFSGMALFSGGFVYLGLRYFKVAQVIPKVAQVIAEMDDLKTQLEDEQRKGKEVQESLSSIQDSYKELEEQLEMEISKRYQVEVQIQTLQVAVQKQEELERQEFESQNVEGQSSVDLCLVSAVVGDYTKLRDLLAAQKWKEADLETYERMLEVADRKLEGWLRVKDVEHFPCKDLVTIDELWVKYSNGRFGLSVQRQIYQSIGGIDKYDYAVVEAFGNRVGWRQKGEWLSYDTFTFGESNEIGYLPARCYLNRVASLLFAGVSKSMDCDI